MVTQSAGHEHPQQTFEPVPLRMATGQYTGDGATSKAVTGVGFRPKYVRIWTDGSADATATQTFETTDKLVDNSSDGYSIIDTGAAIEGRRNEIISLDADGFTVDDDGADAHPNTNGTGYQYLAIG